MTSDSKLSLMITGTRRAILEYLLESDANAVTLANRLRINISAIRNHLAVLEIAGLITSRHERANRGRPKRLYYLTPLAYTLFPQKTEQVTWTLFQILTQSLDENTVKNLVSEAIRKLWHQIIPEKPSGSLRNRLEQITQALDAFGFYASLDTINESFVIIIRNDVFREALSGISKELQETIQQELRKILARAIGKATIKWITPSLPTDRVIRVIVTERRET